MRAEAVCLSVRSQGIGKSLRFPRLECKSGPKE
jgi:hypothetical protein